MTDFWEALGRLVYEPEVTKQFTLKFPDGHSIPRAIVEGQKGLKIPAEKYVAIQAFFAPLLTQGILSVMAAGELYWAFSFKDTPANIKNLQDFLGTKKTQGHSTGFFIALGMIIVDRYLRDEIQAKTYSFEAGPLMSETERSQIIVLASDPGFNELALRFCARPWDGWNCDVTATVWKYRLQPLALSEEDKDDKHGKDDDGKQKQAERHKQVAV